MGPGSTMCNGNENEANISVMTFWLLRVDGEQGFESKRFAGPSSSGAIEARKMQARKKAQFPVA